MLSASKISWLVWVAAGFLLLVTPQEMPAQTYLSRFVTNDYGAIIFTGNTLGLARHEAANGSTRERERDDVGAFTTLDTNSQVTPYPAGTTVDWSNNSSFAVLRIPANSTILYAELIWAGATHTNRPPSDADGPIEFISPNHITSYLVADPLTTNFNSGGFYTRSTNVTALVQAGGAGNYSVGKVWALPPIGSHGNTDTSNRVQCACGWTLAVVYSTPSMPMRNLTLFVGDIKEDAGDAPTTISLFGFTTPPTDLYETRLYVSAIEGDSSGPGDQIRLGPTMESLMNDASLLSGPNNTISNFFASQINNDRGQLDKTGYFGLSNSTPPGVGFCARQGWDITSIDVSHALTNNGLTSASVQIITVGEAYALNALALQIEVASAKADLAVGMAGPATTNADLDFSYSISVTNLGPDTATNIVLTDILPAGADFVDATGSWHTNEGVVTWTIGNLAVNDSTNVSLTLTATQPGTLTNTASATSDTHDLDLDNNTNSITTTIDAAKYSFSVAPVFEHGWVWDQEVFPISITIRNEGPSRAKNAAFECGWNILSQYSWSTMHLVTFQPTVANINSDGTIAPRWTWQFDSILVNQETNIHITVQAALLHPNQFGNGLGYFYFSPDSSGIHWTLTVSNTTPFADLVVTNSSVLSANAYADIQYTLTVTNKGPYTATNVLLVDTLPASLVFVSGDADVLQVMQGANRTLQWNLENLPAHGTTNKSFTAYSTWPAMSGQITNQVEAHSDNLEVHPLDNTNYFFTRILTALPADVAVTNEAPATITNADWGIQADWAAIHNPSGVTAANPSSAPVHPSVPDPDLNGTKLLKLKPTPKHDDGCDYTYTITVTNCSAMRAVNVIVRDQLPNGLDVRSASDHAMINLTMVTWNLGIMEGHATKQLTLTVNPLLPGKYSNTVSVSAENEVPGTSANNTSSTMTAGYLRSGPPWHDVYSP